MPMTSTRAPTRFSQLPPMTASQSSSRAGSGAGSGGNGSGNGSTNCGGTRTGSAGACSSPISRSNTRRVSAANRCSCSAMRRRSPRMPQNSAAAVIPANNATVARSTSIPVGKTIRHPC